MLVEFRNHKKEILRGLLDEAKSDKGIIFIHGFERTTIEYKFKNVVDKLRGKVNMLRFDFSGCGLSDGKFEDMTAEKSVKELEKAILEFKKICAQIKKIILVAHSFGCCIALKLMAEGKEKIEKAVFFGPVFNQRELQRFWFVGSVAKDKEITWQNFRQYLVEEDFEKFMRLSKRMSKAHYISSDYYLENKEKDYADLFKNLKMDLKNMLIINGDADDKVPIESNNKLPKDIRLIKVLKGDHDLQRMDMVEQYLDELIKFLIK